MGEGDKALATSRWRTNPHTFGISMFNRDYRTPATGASNVVSCLTLTIRAPLSNRYFLPNRPRSTLAVDLPTARSTSSVGSDTEVKASPFTMMDQGQSAATPSPHLRAAQPQEMSAMRSTTNSTASEDFLVGDFTNKLPPQSGNPMQEVTAASNASLTGTIDAPPTPTQVRCGGIACQGSLLILHCDGSKYGAVSLQQSMCVHVCDKQRVLHAPRFCLPQAAVTPPLSARSLGTPVQHLEAAKFSLAGIVEAGKVRKNDCAGLRGMPFVIIHAPTDHVKVVSLAPTTMLARYDHDDGEWLLGMTLTSHRKGAC